MKKRTVVWKGKPQGGSFQQGGMYSPVVDMVTDGPGTHNLVMRSSSNSMVATVPAGQVMVYVGAVLQRQRDVNERLVEFSAHTFMYAGHTYTVSDPNLLKHHPA